MVQKEKMSNAYDYLPSFHTLPKIKNNCVLPYLTFGEEEFCDMAYYRKKHEVVEQKIEHALVSAQLSIHSSKMHLFL